MNKHYQKILFFTIFFASFSILNASSQAYIKLNFFTTNEGLPSNHIYEITEDNKGFLWIATDNGVSRFDGKYFQNFSIKDGLPSNDVLQIVKENNGTIWVNCYKESPAYFDEKNNRFIKFVSNDSVNKLARNFYLLYLTSEGDVAFKHRSATIFLRNKLIVDYNENHLYGPLVFGNQKNNYSYSIVEKENEKSIFLFENNIKKDSITLPINKGNNINIYYNCFSSLKNNCYYKVSVTGANPFVYNIDSIEFKDQVISQKITANNQSIITTSNGIYILKENTCQIQSFINSNVVTNVCYTDVNKNIWLGTLDNGLLFYNTNGIIPYIETLNSKHNNFLSVAARPNGEIFAGNYYGELVHKNKNIFITLPIAKKKEALWLRKTFCMGSRVVTINDAFCNIDNKKSVIIKKRNWVQFLKSGIALNDSILIIGTIDGLVKLNINTQQYEYLNCKEERITNLTNAISNTMYYVGADGLYKYDFTKNTATKVLIKNIVPNTKLATLKFAIDSTLWVSTSGGNLFVLKNDETIASIENNIGLPENITCMISSKNKLWLGSKSGITIINYQVEKKKLKYSLNTISKADGLPSNIINDFATFKDTIVVATENGVASFSEKFTSTIATVTPQLIGVKVNQQNLAINENLVLEYHQNNIALSFAGVDLTGHFKKNQYIIDNDTIWNDLVGNILNIQLASGNHKIKIRAIDVNNNINKKILVLTVSIATPFYKAPWFWLLIAMAFSGIATWFYNTRKFGKQKRKYEQQLAIEKERTRIIDDLHDDIGSSISSINMYSNIAQQLVETDITKTRKMLDKLSNQSHKLMENLSEIIWSMKTDDNQLMTLDIRIKTHISDVLGAAEMQYSIDIEPNIDLFLQNIKARKNIMLIIKEATNNITKYSKATNVQIALYKKANTIVLTIKDDGIGLQNKATQGNGINNIKKRTQELSGSCTITSNTNEGVKIECVFKNEL